MSTTPVAAPAATPLAEPTVARLVLLLDHVPPPVTLANAMLPPTHTTFSPVLDAGNAFTVKLCNAAVVQPKLLDTVYVNVTTPTPIAETRPDELTVAMDVFPPDQVPPVAEGVSVVVSPSQRELTPVIDTAEGAGFTVIVFIV